MTPTHARVRGTDTRFERYEVFRYTKGEVREFLGVTDRVMARAWKAVGVGSSTYAGSHGRHENFDPDLVYGVPFEKVVAVMRFIYLNSAKRPRAQPKPRQRA